MAKVQWKCRLTQIRELTPSMRELSLEVLSPERLKFKAGQFVILHVPLPPGSSKPAPRAYSLASDAAKDGDFKLLIKLVPGGLGSEFIKSLKGGEELPFTGPFGKCLFHEPAPAQVLMISTGAGLSQHMSFLFSHAANSPQSKFHALIGVWNESEIFYRQELDALQTRLKNFRYEFVLDQGGPGWQGKTGYVTQHIDQFDYLRVPTMIYLCGNPAMIKGMKAMLAEKGFPAESIVEEAFH